MSQKWLRSYECRRIRTERELNESWSQSKYNTGDWRTDQKTFIKSLGRNVGVGWWTLRRLWKKYKMLTRQGEYADDVAYEICRIAAALDIGRVDLPETEHYDDSEFGIGVSDNETEQEQEEELEPEQDLTIEEVRQLKREEAESEAEAEAEAKAQWEEADEPPPETDNLPW